MKAGVSMKKMMQKLIAAMLTLACVPVTGAVAHAEYYIPSTTWSKFEGREPVNTYGLIGDENDLVYADEEPLAVPEPVQRTALALQMEESVRPV